MGMIQVLQQTYLWTTYPLFWGINHIYAKSESDLFFAQGYAAARDRLFQFERWRRQATGTVAEILGRKELKRDIGTRLHMFRGDLKAELNWYHPHGEAIITAYVRGVNAYITGALTNPSAADRIAVLGIKPAPWTPMSSSRGTTRCSPTSARR